MTVRVTYSTMGQSTPATVAEGTRYYTYGGKQPLEAQSKAETLPQNRIASAAKRARFAEYTRRRLAGESKAEAAEHLGIKASTAAYYERDFKEQQRRGCTP